MDYNKRIYKMIMVKVWLAWLLLVNLLYAEAPAPKDSLSTYYLKLKNLQEANASLLVPDIFKQTVNEFKNANEALEDNDSIKYKGIISLIEDNIVAMEEIVIQSQTIFKPLFTTRQQAMRHGAMKNAESIWLRGEQFLAEAVKALNNGKRDKAAKYASFAVDKYKLAEFQSLKLKYLSDAIMAINRAKKISADKRAPRSFKRSIKYLREAETLIKNEPRNYENIINTAVKAEQEAEAAEYYAQIILENNDDAKNFEKILIENHDRLSSYYALLGLKSDSFRSTERLDTAVSLELEKMVNERKMLASEINSCEKQLKELMIKIDSCRQKEIRDQEYKKKIANIKTLFREEKADVIVMDGNITLRLFDVKFSSNNSVIPPEYFGVFNKVIQAVKEFGSPELIIAVHTDSRGKASKNKQISTKQAAAVKDFITQSIENYSGIIETQGMGEAEPIADNSTAKGRAMNRRIDIIIQEHRFTN